MALEQIPIRITLNGDHLVYGGETFYANVLVKFNGKTVVEQTPVINDDDDRFYLEFMVDYDDDSEDECTLEIHHDTPGCENIKEGARQAGGGEDVQLSIHIINIEILDVSMDYVTYRNGTVYVKLCLEDEYDDNSFIQGFLIPEDRLSELKLIDTEQEDGTITPLYWWVSEPGDYLHGDNTHYEFKFRSPLYIWLLDSLMG
jgi:hypothetical protein